MNEKIIHEKSCNSKFPCRKYFTCARCARIRQSRIARTIHQPASEQQCRTWQVYKVDEDAHIPTITAKITRALRPLVAGGMWTIEYGNKGMGLHLNVLTASHTAPPPLHIDGISHRWQSDIKQTDSGFVAAYITKQSQLPPREMYAGRTVALFGDWRGRDAKPLREYTVQAGASMMRLADIYKTMVNDGKSLGYALINANALLAIMREIAPDVLTQYEREQSRIHLQTAISTLHRASIRAGLSI